LVSFYFVRRVVWLLV